MTLCGCGKNVRTNSLRKHVREYHRKEAYYTLIESYLQKSNRDLDVHECSVCDNIVLGKDKVKHVRDNHFDQAINSFADSMK